MLKTNFLDPEKFIEIETSVSELKQILKTMEEGTKYFITNKNEVSKNIENGCPRVELTSYYSLGNGMNLALTWRPKYKNGELINY